MLQLATEFCTEYYTEHTHIHLFNISNLKTNDNFEILKLNKQLLRTNSFYFAIHVSGQHVMEEEEVTCTN